MIGEIFVQRKTLRAVKEGSNERIAEKLCAAINDKPEVYGSTEATSSEIISSRLGDGGYQFDFVITLENNSGKSDSGRSKHIQNAKNIILDICKKEKISAKTEKQTEIISEYIPLFVPEKIDSSLPQFEGIYERDAHLRVINSGVISYMETKKKVREHTLLFGEPAACKTKLFMSLKNLYESNDPYMERVMLLNSTTMSKAGLENLLCEKAESGIAPDIIMFDEIEKCDPNTLSCLLEIMDGQGRVSRTNSKVGNISYEIQAMVWATTNNVAKIKGWFDGALYSRFTKRLPCVRPSPDLMRMILVKELEKWEKVYLRKVNYKWVDIVMDYAKKRKENDPREIIAYLNGGKRLEDGSYFRDLEDIEKVHKQAEEFKKLGAK